VCVLPAISIESWPLSAHDTRPEQILQQESEGLLCWVSGGIDADHMRDERVNGSHNSTAPTADLSMDPTAGKEIQALTLRFDWRQAASGGSRSGRSGLILCSAPSAVGIPPFVRQS